VLITEGLWDRKGSRHFGLLKWLADINALLAAAPEASSERLFQAAETRGAGLAAAQALLLC
jgi:hypothetical protein